MKNLSAFTMIVWPYFVSSAANSSPLDYHFGQKLSFDFNRELAFAKKVPNYKCITDPGKKIKFQTLHISTADHDRHVDISDSVSSRQRNRPIAYDEPVNQTNNWTPRVDIMLLSKNK